MRTLLCARAHMRTPSPTSGGFREKAVDIDYAPDPKGGATPNYGRWTLFPLVGGCLLGFFFFEGCCFSFFVTASTAWHSGGP